MQFKLKQINNGIIFSDISDHLSVYVIYTLITDKLKKKQTKYKSIIKINHNTINKLKESINNYDWHYIYSDIYLYSILNTFTTNVIHIYNKYNSNCSSIKVKENKPWLYSSLIKSIIKKIKCIQKYIFYYNKT